MQYDRMLSGKRIQEARKKKLLTQDQLSEQLGITEKALSEIERGKSGMRMRTLMALCEILEVSPNYLLSYEGKDEGPISELLRDVSAEDRKDIEEIIRIFVNKRKREI